MRHSPQYVCGYRLRVSCSELASQVCRDANQEHSMVGEGGLSLSLPVLFSKGVT